MTSFGIDMPGPVSQLDIERGCISIWKMTLIPISNCIPNTDHFCAWSAHPLRHCLLTAPPLGGCPSGLQFWPASLPLPPATFTLKKVNSIPSGYLLLLLPGDQGWCHFTSTDFNMKSLTLRSLEAAELNSVIIAISTVQKSQNRTSIFFVTDKAF